MKHNIFNCEPCEPFLYIAILLAATIAFFMLFPIRKRKYQPESAKITEGKLAITQDYTDILGYIQGASTRQELAYYLEMAHEFEVNHRDHDWVKDMFDSLKEEIESRRRDIATQGTFARMETN